LARSWTHGLGGDMSFGEQLTHNAIDYDCIFDDWSSEGGELDGPRARMRTADVNSAGIDQASAVTIRLRTFEVRGVQRDGVGTSMLILWEPGT